MAPFRGALVILTVYFVQGIVSSLSANTSQSTELLVRPLYIGSMAPMTGNRAWWGAGIPLAIEMAFEDINARNDVLKGYKLELIRSDTQVSQSKFSQAHQLFSAVLLLRSSRSHCRSDKEVVDGIDYDSVFRAI